MAERRWVLLRHAPAAPRDFTLWPDDHGRPLRESGRKEFRQAAKGLAALLEEQGQMAVSPLARAQETAQILAKEWPASRHLGAWPELRPEASLEELFGRAKAVKGTGDLVLVGHEPELSQFVGYCLTGEPTSILKFARGGAVAIDFPARIRPHGGRLLWAVTRSQLRRISRSPREPEDE